MALSFEPPLTELYTQKAVEAASKATGIEAFVHKILGPEFMGSMTLAVDPLSRFKAVRDVVTPVNRTRQFKISPVIGSRVRTTQTYAYTEYFHFHNVIHEWWGFYRDAPSVTNLTVILGNQDVITGFVKDTTRRTRSFDSDEGEFEKFVPFVKCHPRTDSWEASFVQAVNDWPVGPLQRTVGLRTNTISPSVARINGAALNAMATAEKTAALARISNDGGPLVARTLPESRSFQGFYSIAELRELPRLLEGAVKAAESAYRKRFPKGSKFSREASDAYLETVFGWGPILKDVYRLLRMPEKISKRINYLMKRSGLATTLRSGFQFIEPVSSPPGFSFDLFGDETFNGSVTTSAQRKGELRCMINLGLRLPKISPPKLQGYLLAKKWGLSPNPVDVYNLVPWTWLIDWFGGVGDYIQMIVDINGDKSIINYGFLTYESRVEITSSVQTKSSIFRDLVFNGVHNTGSSYTKIRDVTAVAGYEYTLRKAIGSPEGVRPTSDPSQFTGSQAAILTALILSKSR